MRLLSTKAIANKVSKHKNNPNDAPKHKNNVNEIANQENDDK